MGTPLEVRAPSITEPDVIPVDAPEISDALKATEPAATDESAAADAAHVANDDEKTDDTAPEEQAARRPEPDQRVCSEHR